MSRFRIAAAIFGPLLWLLGSDADGAQGRDLLDRLAAAESGYSTDSQVPAEAADLRSRIVELRKEFTSIAGSLPLAQDRVSALNRFVFARLAIQATQDLKDPDNLLPSRVLERRQGYCVGIAAIYLALAEGVSWPIHAVATPSHVFLRYDDGTARINIETMDSGAIIPDEQYIREQRIPEASIQRGVFMRNLRADEFLAQVHNNLGVVYSERKEFERAAREYGEALKLDHRLPAAWYNYGTDLLRQGDQRRAARYFSKSLRLYSTDVWALNNRGLAWLKAGKKDKARKDFLEALQLDPGFQQAKQNLAGLPSTP